MSTIMYHAVIEPETRRVTSDPSFARPSLSIDFYVTAIELFLVVFQVSFFVL